ncbi:conserved repeat domain-containing protein [Sphingomonas guangdongensis]|uniref:Conserved repeat domain-containing protein n=1 Tax=Sphingomonas guangdongensis TaxID=1141890 RepID=A0A285QD66_9SPHN|nr:hypothetical protein [Sphingomonas guangdongensis]SOB79468.1 conserved repeat domain-containing protein [Sphingomonas guangdongensis]
MIKNGNVNGTQALRVTAASLLACVAAVPAAVAQVTPAGTRITNTATLTHADSAGPITFPSNTVTTSVDGLVDVTVVAAAATRVVADPASQVAVPFVVTNTGNLAQDFSLAGSGGEPLRVAIDSDGTNEATRITLTPGEQQTIFVLLPGPVVDRTAVTLTATAVTGTGVQGSVLPGAGPDGSDAVLGGSGGRATAQTVLILDPAAPSLTKSQAVRAPDGSERAINGATITYQLVARFPGAKRGVVITDAIPAGTRFVADSVTLDGIRLTDADDGDAVTFDGTTVRVTLGDPTPGTVRTVRFQTIIN